ncbi:MAG: monofunctional biosynthetic peptidoglycan transglycosylase [Cytophagales bacterium]|nr:MAG: monofunctional biosynthetic peptidoglycan transglycosylase [Cytophagales bacterium]
MKNSSSGFLFSLLKWFNRLLIYFLISSVAAVLILRFVPVLFTPLMFTRVVEQVIEGRNIKLSKEWKSLSEVSDYLPQAVVASEDQLFLEHRGFDVASIKKAWQNNSKSKTKLKGASTISQQVAKNVFLWQGRSYLRKGFEAYFTVLIELFWSKQRIVEVYLNIVELGDGVYGVEAASQESFYKSAKNVSKSQAAMIAAVLPNPRKWSLKNPNAYIKKRQAWILRQMNNIGNVEWK